LLLAWQTRLLLLVGLAAAAVAGGWWGGAFAAALGALLLLAGYLSAQRSAPAPAEAAIARERDRLEMVLAATIEGVIALDRSGNVTLMNEAAGGLLSVARGECIGKPLDAACNVPALSRLADKAMLTGELSTTEITHDDKLLEVYATPLQGQMGVVLVLHDITEMRRLESVRRDFVANVSHELKTPLTSIRAYVETLMDGGLRDAENNMRFLQKIDAHVNRLAAIITDLLSLSRIEAGKAFSPHLRLDVRQPLLETYQRLGPTAEGKGLRIKVLVQEEPLEVLGDLEALQQVFDNLIDNAIKYTEPGGTVEVGARHENAHVRIDVKDTGVGIPQEDLPRIFERFYRVDKARSRELGGTGLGLSIVKHYVQALGGELQVESQLGIGSTFTVKLPRA
jgi:two-component system phosphate regulon sensor histidine kinase PhoR